MEGAAFFKEKMRRRAIGDEASIEALDCEWEHFHAVRNDPAFMERLAAQAVEVCPSCPHWGWWMWMEPPLVLLLPTFLRGENKRFAARNTKIPSLLQGLAACSACGCGYYRTSARTARRKICYYRCLGSDTAPKVAGSVTTSRSAPATLTRSSGITSPACSPIPR